MFAFIRIPRTLVAAIGAVAVLGLAACGGGEQTPDAGEDLCADVTCPANEACNPDNGQCEQRACDPACSGTTPVCDPTTVTCVTCTATEGCGGDTPLCDPQANGGAGACVECTGNEQCGGATPYCANNTCVTCTGAEGCTGQSVCDAEANGGRGACVGCVSNTDCMGATPVCNPTNNTCVSCLADTQCSGATPACDPATNQCVGCNSNVHCSGATPVCDTTSRSCVTCRGDMDCSGATPVCDTAANAGAGACVGCVDSADCSGATPVCNAATNACVACLGDAECGGATPVCDTTTFACVGCTTNSHCGGAAPVCDEGSNQCVTCRGDGDCSGATPICDEGANGGAGACVGCLSDAECGGATPTCDTATTTCVACLSDAECSGATPACSTATHTCVTCTGDTHCAATSQVCDTAVTGGACVDCFTDGQCAANERCETNTCVSIPDTCATAAPIAFGAGQTVSTFPVNAAGAAHDYAGTCGSSSAREELVYHLQLAAAQDVKIDVTGGSGHDAVFFVRTAPCDTGAQLTCADSTGSGVMETRTLVNLQPGDYYLFIEAYGATPFVGTATVTLLPPTLPVPGQTCASAAAITPAEGSPSIFSVDTAAASATNDYTGTCYSSGTGSGVGREFVYALTLTQPQDVTFAAVGQGSVDPVIYVRSSPCQSGTQLECRDVAGQSEVINLFNLQPGEYFLFVEQWNTTRGIIDVTVTVNPPTLPPTNDTCATAQPLALVPGTPTTVNTNTALAGDDTAGTCVSTTNSREVVYTFTTTTAQDLHFVATGATGVNPVLYLRSGACEGGTQVACLNGTGSGGTETLNLLNQPAGTYYLFVETAGTAAGAVELTANLLPATPPPSNESCASPETLALTPGTPLQFTANTVQSTDDETGTCNSTTASREVVYAFTTTTAQDFHFVATGATGVNPALYLRAAPCTGGTQLACVNATTNGGTETLTLGNQPAGTYYLVVETVGTAFGAVNVTMNLNPPTTNDSCTAPAVLSLTPGTPTAFTADTRFATHVETGSCNGTANSRELVYAFTTTAAQDVVVTATGGTGVNPVLYLRSATCDGTQLACVNATSTNATETLIAPDLPAGDYFLVVETSGTSFGLVEVTVNLDAPTTNQSCTAPQLLAVTPGTPLQFSVDTRYATDDESASCNATANSRELVYMLTTTAAQDIQVTATGASGVNPVLYLREGTCTNTTNLACQNATSTAGTETVISYDRPAGTYYLVVETVGTSMGAVSVTVNLNPPTPMPANDTCATAQALLLPANLSGYTTNSTHDYAVASGCGTATGPDVVYEVTTTTPGTLFARVTPRTAGYRPTVSVRELAQCTSGTTATTEGCITAPAVDAAAELQVSDLPAGTWYLVVDGNIPGSFDLQVTHSPFTPDPNETCGSAELLTFSNGVSTLYGSTAGMTDDHQVTCSSTASAITADAVYRFSVPALQPGQTGYQARAVVRSLNFDEYTPALSMRSACADDTSASQGACASSTTSPFSAAGFVTSSQTNNPLVPGADYFIVVDGSTSTASKPGDGAYRLDVMMGPVPHPYDACAGASPLPTNTPVQGTTLGAGNDFTLAAGHYTNAAGTNLSSFSFAGMDVVYAWTAPATGTATVTLIPDPNYDPGFVVMSACAPDSAVAYADVGGSGRPDTASFEAQQGTTYYVVVDYFSSTTTAVGGFELTVSQ